MLKKNLPFIFIALIILAIYAVYFFKKENPSTPIPKKLETPELFTYKDTCYLEDSVSFKEYQEREVKESDIQKNIGYVNNKFGLYVYSEETFIKKADEMINTNGGDWGYVLIPYNVRDYDESKWDDIFELLNKKHLIPIIQLWDIEPDNYKKETEKSAEFLNKLSWPIDKKYISAYNEMNDPGFFREGADPELYAEILDYTIKTYKGFDPKFFIMNGALNVTAPNVNGYVDAEVFMVRMNDKIPGIFGKLDGWASHSYPWPDYVGKPTDTGRGSIKTYEWELSVLKNRFNVSDLPVFITETGWPHAEGDSYTSRYLPQGLAASYLKQAFENVWLKDERVVAVTPFTIYYNPPYDHFSFVKKNGDVYEAFTVIKDMKKTAGRPPVLFETEKEMINCP